VPTAVTGASDWADTELSDPTVRRLGVVHAATNAAAQLLYAASLAARLRGKRGRGRLLALPGAGVLGGRGYLGAHMSYPSGVGVNQTAFDSGSPDWTDVMASADLAEGHPRHAEADGTPIMLLRSGGRIYAIDDRCSHRGCLLSDGELEENVVMCSCHGSRFDVRDGTLLRGPAIVGQPAHETRDNNGRIEVRQLP
jgi:nitrite reductase/ring-hydroxylating ferredoxin subunit